MRCSELVAPVIYVAVAILASPVLAQERRFENLTVSSATTETRVALVIGNGAYQQVPPLLNPMNDATAIATSLERMGFQVRRVTDGTFDDMRRALLDFAPRARSAEIAIFFYAGHGMEVARENWLIPIDAAMSADADAEHEAISLRSIIATASGASRLGLVILDACRDNPFLARMQRKSRTRSTISRGLQRIEPTGSVLVAYAAKDGTTAADGDARNSPFTAALLRHLETPELEINFLFRNVRDDVLTATNGMQEPFVYGSLSKEAIFLKTSLKPAEADTTISIPTPPAIPIAPAEPSLDDVAWRLIMDTDNADLLRRFIRQFPNSRHRSNAEQRIDRIANLPSLSPQPSAPAPPVKNIPPARQTAPAPAAKKSGAHAGPPRSRPTRPSGNCTTFNGQRFC